MGISKTWLPENIRKCMTPADRQCLGLPTSEEGIASEDAKCERDLQKQILAFLQQRDIEVSCPSMVRRSTIKTGWPDMTFAFHGAPVVFEIKTMIGKLTPEQESIAPKLKSNGWYYAVIRSIEQAREFLEIVERANAAEMCQT